MRSKEEIKERIEKLRQNLNKPGYFHGVIDIEINALNWVLNLQQPTNEVKS